ncbi:MAG: aminotransferase class I/II-fold pyridoxal phosphate-dependent enzyme [Lachnospiraceae bacterium]|nr:aminotransferase class I/II-fold pyridoxal phosphate-dependent enzyme [Lachnospiraceae bacterium]MBQ8328034.1 aminotransferase class I/II-fold pyridoxal phosphate-dependent enzyme [Lachnospiraceae bacterium]
MEHGGDIYGNKNIELDFSVNLSPIGPPQEVCRLLKEEDWTSILTNYPDPEYRELRQALSQKMDLPEDWILCGNGASELLMAVAQAVRPKRAMIPVPSYQGYERALQAVGAEILFYQLDREKGFTLMEDILERADGLKRLAGTKEETMLFLCNPNNPVGKCIEPELLDKIADYCKTNHIFLVVDECYLDLLPEAQSRTMKRKLPENPHLIIVNAFTKAYALPGIRLGYLATDNEELRERIRLQQPEWSVSMFAQKAGIAALSSRGYLEEARQAVQAERGYISGQLRELGMKVFDGEAPFVMFLSSKELYEPLKEKGILIRKCDRIRGIRDRSEERGHYYRVGIRSHAENVRLMKAIREVPD